MSDLNPSFSSAGTYGPDLLMAGDHPVRTRLVTITAGAAHVRGELLGKITASGEYELADDAAADGSETPAVILAEDVDATGGAVSGVVAYVAGDFNANAMTFGGTLTAAGVRDALQTASIYIHDAVSA